MNISRHGKKRIHQRTGVTKGSADKVVKMAYSHGITHSQASGTLKEWMDKQYLGHDINTCRYWAGKLYIFGDNLRLVTVLDNQSIEKDLINNVESYDIYIAYRKARIKNKRNPEYMQKLNQEIYEHYKEKIDNRLYEITQRRIFWLEDIENISTAVIGRHLKRLKTFDKETKRQVIECIEQEFGFDIKFKYIELPLTEAQIQSNEINRVRNNEVISKYKNIINNKCKELSPNYIYEFFGVNEGKQVIIGHYTKPRDEEAGEKIRDFIRDECGLQTLFKFIKGSDSISDVEDFQSREN